MGILEIANPASELSIEMECLIELAEENPFNFALEPEVAEFPFEYSHDMGVELHGLTVPVYPRDSERIREWLYPIWHLGKRCETLTLLQDINKALYNEIKYQRRERRGVQTPAETLERKTGACRDFATLFMEICRFLGIAARFVSGYMYSEDIAGRMSMHGWAEVYLPGAGWLGFDPSWGIVSTSSYIPVAVSLHPEHVPPISGTYFGLAKEFLGTQVDLFVERVDTEVSNESEKSSSNDQKKISINPVKITHDKVKVSNDPAV
jgi:hypothetical protein